MNTYVTEEEQIEAIKRWWNKYGNLISTVVLVIALCVLAYRWYESHQLATKVKASQTFEQLMRAYAENDEVGMKAQANYLRENYPSTIYASGAAMILSRLSVNKNQLSKAKGELNWVIDNSRVKPIKQLARIRLARIESEQKHFDKALSYLRKVDDKTFLSLVFEVKGDIYHAKGDNEKAKSFYLDAKRHLPKEYRNQVSLLSMKLNQISALDSLKHHHKKSQHA